MSIFNCLSSQPLLLNCHNHFSTSPFSSHRKHSFSVNALLFVLMVTSHINACRHPNHSSLWVREDAVGKTYNANHNNTPSNCVGVDQRDCYWLCKHHIMDTEPHSAMRYWSPRTELLGTMIHLTDPWSPLLVSSICAGQIEPFESIQVIMAMVMWIDPRTCVVFHLYCTMAISLFVWICHQQILGVTWLHNITNVLK